MGNIDFRCDIIEIFFVLADCLYIWCRISVVSNALVSSADLFSCKLKSFTLLNYLFEFYCHCKMKNDVAKLVC